MVTNVDKITEYNQLRKDLFARWKAKLPKGQINHRDAIFVSDGIVNPLYWFNQDVRPLFLLKEAYGGHSDWDLIQDHLLTNEPIGDHLTWRRVTQWACGLLNTTADSIYSFEKLERTPSFGNKYLQQVAAVNVKKSDGRKTSRKRNLMAYAEYDKEELLEQLKLIDPTLIVCGYTMDYLNVVLPQPIKKHAGQSPNLYYKTQLNGHEVLVIDYWHPSNKYPDLMNYYTLMAIYQQALKEGII